MHKQLGLFAGCRSTIHWKCLAAYRELHPDLDVRASIYEIDGQRFSCAGGTAALYLFLRLVALDHGASLAAAVAENLITHDIRPAEDAQRTELVWLHGRRDVRLASAIMLMEENVERCLSVTEIAQRSGTALRQLERLFADHIGVGPSDYYWQLRVQRAARLLRQTPLRVEE